MRIVALLLTLALAALALRLDRDTLIIVAVWGVLPLSLLGAVVWLAWRERQGRPVWGERR